MIDIKNTKINDIKIQFRITGCIVYFVQLSKDYSLSSIHPSPPYQIT